MQNIIYMYEAWTLSGWYLSICDEYPRKAYILNVQKFSHRLEAIIHASNFLALP